jgi:filamentous hemagglutinin family protein
MGSLGVLASGQADAAQLPVPCVAGTCGRGPSTWVTSGAASATATANSLTINQTTDQVILNWASFDVSADGSVIFKQPNTTSIALNKIFQATPSQIFGMVQANGQIYLVNQNGFVFGRTSQVNVGGLLASTLDISEDRFKKGLLSAINENTSAARSDGQVDAAGNTILGSDGNPIPASVVVQQGATLSTNGPGQRLMLAGNTVDNSGTLRAPDGQVVLAAGQQLFLQASTDPALRGLVVAVDGPGLVANRVSGDISSDHGNVTLVGLAVNQEGRISATTSVKANGSIYLLAHNGVDLQQQAGVTQPLPVKGGSLTLGSQSLTTVMPDTADTSTAVDDQAQLPSTLRLDGQQVVLAGGSRIVSPSGQLTITANTNADPLTQRSSIATPDPAAHLRIDSGAVIDLSGSTATVPVTRNLVTAQLRGNELAGNPQQRDGKLRGQTVVVDARADGGLGTKVADLSGEIALTQRDILERTSQGGSAVFDSTGDVVLAQGARVDVSGGRVDYTGGIMQTTQLVGADGSLVDIGKAAPDKTYVGILNPQFKVTYDRWGVIQFVPSPGIAHYEPGYVQGASAGSVQFLGSSMVLNGTLTGNAVNGPYQRSGAGMALGGQLIIGTAGTPGSGVDALNGDYRAPAVQLSNTTPNIVVADNASLPSDLPVTVPIDFIEEGGFSRIRVASNDGVVVPSGVSLNLAPGGSLSLLGPRIEQDGSISAPSGAISLLATGAGSAGAAPGIFIGDHASFDVSGSWVNDFLLPVGVRPSGAALINGGSISITQQELNGQNVGGELSIGSDVQMRASGGASVATTGATSGGKGGSISLRSGDNATFEVGSGLEIDGFGVQGAAGGSFSLQVPRLAITSGDSTWLRPQTVSYDPLSGGVLNLDASLFPSFGFAAFSLAANGPPLASDPTQNVLTIGAGTHIDLRAESLMLPSSALNRASGGSVFAFATPQLLPSYQRLPSQLTLSAVAPGDSFGTGLEGVGNLFVAQGAELVADPKSAISMASLGTLDFEGHIEDPAGSVSLSIVYTGSHDTGYRADQVLQLGHDAAIDVSGTAIYTPVDSGLLGGQVLGGGSVSLIAQRGWVVMKTGSSIDVSGTAAPLDLSTGAHPTPVRTQVASAAGSVTIQAGESVSLLGDLRAQPGVGDIGPAAGGSLSVTLSRLGTIPANDPVIVATFPTTPRTVLLEPDDGGQPQYPASGIAAISTSRLASSGFDSLRLIADDVIEFAPGVQLSLGRQFIAQSPVLSVDGGGSATVSAPYIALGSGVVPSTSTNPVLTPLPGTGTLSFSADMLDLIGFTSIQGAGRVTLASTGDLRLRGDESTLLGNAGAFAIAGDLTLSAAQIWPATGTSFTIEASGGASNTVRIEPSGPSTWVPLSAAGSLTVNADDIEQSGTLLAPFGSISLNATQALNLNGGIVSVSGAGATIPYGRVDNGTTWVYTGSSAEITGIPQRTVSLVAPKVSIATGATVDLSGGGDLVAYQFTPGTGGKVDALDPAVTPGLYAVLPNLRNGAGPYDPMLWAQSGLQVGETVYLGGGGGLAAGTYTLLPARYALLPGAFLVSKSSSFADLAPGTAAFTPDGAAVVAGRITFAGTDLGDTRYSGFVVRPGSYALQLAEYTSNLASQFFTPAAGAQAAPGSRPADGGALLVSVQESLDALGHVLSKAADSGGEGGTIELTAPSLEVTAGNGASATSGEPSISAAVLQSWGPGRLFLGGHQKAPGSLQVDADTVHVDTGAALSLDQIVLAARQNITLDAGASVTSRSLAGGAAAPAAANFATPATLTLTGTGADTAAILAVSDLANIQPVRTSAGGGTAATITLADGSLFGSRGALTIDASGVIQIADSALSGAGASWTLAAQHVAFGPGTSAPDGLAIDDSLLAALNGAGTVRIASRTSIDLLEPVSLGSPGGAASLTRIELDAPTLNNLTSGAASQFSATHIVLSNTSGGAPALTGGGSGTIDFNASQFDFGAGSGPVALSGFDTVSIQASQAVLAQGSGAAASGDLSITAPLLVAGSGGQTVISAAGNLSLTSPASGGGVTPISATSGGSILLSGQQIVDQTTIRAHSGAVSLTATGQGLTIGAGAVIDTSGSDPLNTAHGSDGGTITLVSAGDISVDPSATLNVSSGSAARAGSITVSATGNASLQGTLVAPSDPGFGGGTFRAQVGTLTDFADLNQHLESGGFTAERDYEVTSGSLLLGAAERITAQHVQLIADAGSVTVAGSINASSGGGTRGSIEIAAGDSVSVTSTAQLLASASDAETRGGTLEISARLGSVAIASGATLAASGRDASGRLTIRAPMSGDGTDMSISQLGADLSHVDSVVLQPLLPFTLATGIPGSADFALIQSQAATQLSSIAPNAATRLGVASLGNVAVTPFIDITYTGDLTLPALDLASWRFGSGNLPGEVAFRATGNLTVSDTLSDGFVVHPGLTSGRTVISTTYVEPTNGPSSSIDLIAGADLGAASKAGVQAAAAANLTLAQGAIVRTGTGDLTLGAANDISFAANASVYTGGIAAAPTTTATRNVGATKVTYATSYADQGGSVWINAGRDISSTPLTSTPGDWQHRSVAVNQPAAWGIDFVQFDWNAGALGGGDVSITAGRNAQNVSAAVSDSQRVAAGVVTDFGGGNLRVAAGNDIDSAYLYVARGTGDVIAGGALASSRVDGSNAPVGSLLLAGDASYFVTARGDILLVGEAQASGIFAVPSTTGSLSAVPYYYQYGSDSLLRLASAGGDITIAGGVGYGSYLGTTGFNAGRDVFNVYPASLDLSAFAGDVDLLSKIDLFPSNSGNLSIYAGRDFNAGGQALSLLSLPSSALPSASAPSASGLIDPANVVHSPLATHVGDPLPVRIAAGRDISSLFLGSPKQVLITAGRDVSDLTLSVEHTGGSDTSLVAAGRDFGYSQVGIGGINVFGPGTFELIAGRNVDFGFASGVSSWGNLKNPALPATSGADLIVMAGAGAASDGEAIAPATAQDFINKIVAPSADYQKQLTTQVEGLTGQSDLTFDEAASELETLDAARQLPFLQSVFFRELVAAGREANTTPASQFQRGYAAIDTLFPGSRPASGASNPHAGDISLAFSRIYTLDGGSISLLAPGGAVNVGLANPPPDLALLGINRKPSDLGIVAARQGDVQIFASNDVLVNESRVFTLGGGNIAIWSTLGNIDAGRGAKTAISAPPPVVIADSAGNVITDFSTAVAGSGIRTILTGDATKAGDVDLIAPAGFVNAGDAGIGAAGNLNVAAQRVLGLDNIQVGGASTGVPPAVSNIGAALSGASAASSSTSNAAGASVADSASSTKSAPVASAALGWLDVFVEGFGQEVCKPSDTECLRRQPRAQP